MANAVDKKIPEFFAFVKKGDTLKRVKIIAVSRRASRYGDGYYFISDKNEQFREVIRHLRSNVHRMEAVKRLNKKADFYQKKADRAEESIVMDFASTIYFQMK